MPPASGDEWPSEPAPQPITSSPSHAVRSSPTMTPATSSASSVNQSDAPSTPDNASVRRGSGEGYIPLERCFSDAKKSPLDRQTTRRPTGGSPLDQVPPPPSKQQHRGSVDSIPEMPAPPPPLKTGQPRTRPDVDPNQMYDQPTKSYVNIDSMDGLDDGTYKVPPKRNHRGSIEQESLYKVPPSRHLEFVPSSEEWYQVPPSRGGDGHPPPSGEVQYYNSLPLNTSPVDRDVEYDYPPPGSKSIPRTNSQRDSNSSSESRSSQKQDSAYGSEDTFYSVPPSRRHDAHSMEVLSETMRTSTLNGRSLDDTYDIPPRKAHSETNILDSMPPPPRPPKGGGSPVEPQGPYMNLPPNSKSHPHTDPHPAPRSVDYTNQPSQRSVDYTNQPKIVDYTYDTPPKKPSDAAMLSMSPPPPAPCSIKPHRYVNAPPGYVPPGGSESMYLPMQGGVGEEMYIPMTQGTRDTLYTDMSGVHSIYTAPPSNQPVNQAAYSAKPGTVPPKLQKLSSPTNTDGKIPRPINT